MIFDYFQKIRLRKRVWEDIKKLKNKKGYLKAGLPRYNRLFGRDSLISAWQLLDKNPGISKATLEILSQYQGKVVNNEREEEPGKILHETDFEKSRHPQSYFPFPYYGSIDSTPLFLILFSFYYQRTGDIKFLDSHWKNILMALNWIEEYGDKDKDLFLEYQRKNEKGLFHQAWKDGFEDNLKIEPPVAMVEVQGYQYLALAEISQLAKEKNNFELSKKLEERARKLKEKFNHKFWMEDENFFVLALDAKKQQKKAITSNPGHLLFTGIIDKDKVNFVVQRLFQKDIWTNYGIRTHSKKEPDFDPLSHQLGAIWPHDNWIISQGLKKLGYKKEYLKIKKAILRAYQEIGFAPEFYGVINEKLTLKLKKPACYLQAWSSGAIFNFLSS